MFFSLYDGDLALFNPYMLHLFQSGKAAVAPLRPGGQASNPPPAADMPCGGHASGPGRGGPLPPAHD
eukprot:308415-Pyramimonas_sp.AAC.1